jgi:hypothetical protein
MPRHKYNYSYYSKYYDYSDYSDDSDSDYSHCDERREKKCNCNKCYRKKCEKSSGGIKIDESSGELSQPLSCHLIIKKLV